MRAMTWWIYRGMKRRQKKQSRKQEGVRVCRIISLLPLVMVRRLIRVDSRSSMNHVLWWLSRSTRASIWMLMTFNKAVGAAEYQKSEQPVEEELFGLGGDDSKPAKWCSANVRPLSVSLFLFSSLSIHSFRKIGRRWDCHDSMPMPLCWKCWRKRVRPGFMGSHRAVSQKLDKTKAE